MHKRVTPPVTAVTSPSQREVAAARLTEGASLIVNSTGEYKQERKLWYEFLNKYHPRFQRQKSIDNFIVDFYCHKARLVIELDGSQHFTNEGQSYDEERTKILNAYNLLVIRFTNNDISNNFEGVCSNIDIEIKRRLL